MENILKQLENCNFISSVHDKMLTAEAIRFIENAGLHEDPLVDCVSIKNRSKQELDYLNSFVKFNIMATGLFHYLRKIEKMDNDSLMVNCNIDDQILLVAYKNESDRKFIAKLNFMELGILPIHSTTINLDYDNKVHILLYNKKAEFPEINLN